MSPDLDQELSDSMRSSLESFFVSLRGGPNMLNGFLRTWTAFNHTAQTHRDKLKEETLESIHNFDATIGTVAAVMLELEVEKEKMRDRLATDVSDILNDNINNLFIEEERRGSEDDKPYAAHVKPCYDWLLSNIHNPYPSKEIRNHISRDTDSPCKDVDAWFTDARKRIGWNNLRKRHFSNKRVEIVNAATRLFASNPFTVDGHRPHTIHKTDLKDDHGSDFIAVRQRAKNLYSEGFFEPTLATTLDDADLVPKVASAQPDKSRGPRVHSSSKKHFDQASSYPSPEYSPEPPTPSPLPDISHKAGRKRQAETETETENCSERPHKRNRLDSLDTCDNPAIAGLPSPAHSLPDPSDYQSAMLDLPETNPLSLPTVLQGKRKRRLSDGGNDGPLKRPHNALAVPRLQTVSDPLPLVSPVFSELCKTISGRTISDSIPGPVSVESLDDTQVEVNFYNYNTSPDNIEPFLLANSSGPFPTASFLPLTATSGLPSLDGSQVFDPSFDFLFENYLKNLNTQASTDMPFFPDIPSHDPSTLLPFENMFSIQPPQEDVLSDPLSYFQIPSPSWDFQGSGDSFSATVPSAPSAEMRSSSNHLSSQINPTENEKEAKLKQIEALRAQLQSLEAEL